MVCGAPRVEMPPLDGERLFLKRHPIFWRQWVDAWELANAGATTRLPRLTPVEVLPSGESERLSPPVDLGKTG